MFQPYRYLTCSKLSSSSCCRSLNQAAITANCSSQVSVIRRYISDSFSIRTIDSGIPEFRLGYSGSWRSSWLRFYSSKGETGSNASEDKHVPVKEGSKSNLDKKKSAGEKVNEQKTHSDAHAQLGEQDQKEWLINEKLAIESKRKESPFLARRERYRNEFLRRVVPWEKITVTWKTFPYYLQ